MRISIARHGGFCFGVRRAVDAVEEQLHISTPVYTLGRIIHNPLVTEDLSRRGVCIVNSADDVPFGSTLVIRSHGVPPEVLSDCASRGLTIVDATCPFVSRIHRMAQSAVAQGFSVVIAGDAKHPEVQGILGWAPGAQVVSSVQEVTQLAKMQKCMLLVQTTFDAQALPTIISALQDWADQLVVEDTICSATRERQEEAHEIAAQNEVVLVVGGKESSNTKKLFEIAKQHTSAYWIERANEIQKDWFQSVKTVGIVAGASTPDSVIKEVVDHMSQLEQTQANQQEEQVPAVECQAQTAEEPCQAEEASTAQAQVAEEVAEQNAEPEQDQPKAEPVAGSADELSASLDNDMVKIRRGMIVTGTVVQVSDDEVCVNIGYKSDGILSRRDMTLENDVNIKDVMQVGDKVEVEVVKVNDGEGNVVLSKKNVDARKAWDNLVKQIEEQGSFVGIVKEAVKGGLVATVGGARVFVPASQVTGRFQSDLSKYIGKELPMKVLEMNKQRKQIVGSHKLYQDEINKSQKQAAWANAPEVNDIVHSVVRRITDFGAFCDIGGIDGLLHVSNMAWGRPTNPRDYVKVGDELSVLILAVDKDHERVSLGLKQLMPKPWEIAPEKYPVGTVVNGRVLRTASFGAFVELEPGLDGLVHISQLARDRVEKVEDAVKPGDIVKVIVLEVDPGSKRISLSIRQALEDEDFIEEDQVQDAAEEVVQEEQVEEVQEEVQDHADEAAE